MAAFCQEASEAAGGVHFIHYDGASYAGGRRKGADEPYAADKWTESIDLADITYDSMRLYLVEIGRVNLLTKKQEQTLARQIEEWKHLEAIETEVGSSYERVSERLDVRSSLDTANRPTGAYSGCRLPLPRYPAHFQRPWPMC